MEVGASLFGGEFDCARVNRSGQEPNLTTMLNLALMLFLTSPAHAHFAVYVPCLARKWLTMIRDDWWFIKMPGDQ